MQSNKQRKHPDNKMTSRNNNAIILPDGRVNISLLQSEIIQDISKDAKYYAEDEMKKRAVHTSQD